MKAKANKNVDSFTVPCRPLLGRFLLVEGLYDGVLFIKDQSITVTNIK